MPGRYRTQRRTPTTSQAESHYSSLMALPPRIRMSHTWTGSNSSWTSGPSHKLSARRTEMTNRRSRRTTQNRFATCSLNSVRGASASSFRAVTMASAVGLASQMTVRTADNSSRCSLRRVSCLLSLSRINCTRFTRRYLRKAPSSRLLAAPPE